jgi:5'-nucleotidase
MGAATPTVLVDQDGPLTSRNRWLFELFEKNGWPADATAEQQVHRYATDHLLDPEHRRLARAAALAPGVYRELPPTEGSVEGLARLAAVADVWICTRPAAGAVTCRDEKAAWMAEHHGSHWLERMIMTPDKSRVRGDVLLDDAPWPEWTRQALWTPVIYAEPFNGEGSAWAGLPRWSWADDPATLVTMAATRAWERAQWEPAR